MGGVNDNEHNGVMESSPLTEESIINNEPHDIHHLITNCRVKVCKDGFPERGIYKSAWVDVARENKTKWKISRVEDLVDKKSDAIARETFAEEVESAMIKLNYTAEAAFCRLISEFYGAEGSGVIKAEVPAALGTASQMNQTRMMPNRPFPMSLSKAEVYPVHDLITERDMDTDENYIFPVSPSYINLRNHQFDIESRAKRKARRKLATIPGPGEAARGVAPV
ncbi:hypothetical protein ScPMuIL_005384 [Solemya velum]